MVEIDENHFEDRATAQAIAKLGVRVIALSEAKKMIDQIIEQHGLEDYREGAPFGKPEMSTKVSQHTVGLVHVAGWLMGEVIS